MRALPAPGCLAAPSCGTPGAWLFGVGLFGTECHRDRQTGRASGPTVRADGTIGRCMRIGYSDRLRHALHGMRVAVFLISQTPLRFLKHS